MKRHAKQEKNAKDPKIKNLFLSSMVCLNLLWCYLLFFISFLLIVDLQCTNFCRTISVIHIYV